MRWKTPDPVPKDVWLEPRQTFALWPVNTIEGETLWLEKVWTCHRIWRAADGVLCIDRAYALNLSNLPTGRESPPQTSALRTNDL